MLYKKGRLCEAAAGHHEALVYEACVGAFLSSIRRCILTSSSFITKHLPGAFTRSDDINCVVQKYDERFRETKAEC